MKIPFLNLHPQHIAIKAEMQQAFEQVYDSSWYILGEHVSRFEEAYAQFNNVKYAVGVSNGLDALYLALRALGVGRGDEVIVPSNTFIATVLAVSYLEAKPVFVEPDPETYNISPKNIEAAITSRTKAIMPVHLYGQACEMEAIMAIAAKHKIFVVEDNAQAHQATYNGKITGSWGHLNGVSFYPGKNLGALGDAGAITTDNVDLMQRVKMLRNYGSQVKYKNEAVGHNMRLDELQASFLSVKLKYLSQWTAQRREIAGWYDQGLKGAANIILPSVAKGATHVYHLYVIRSASRDALQQYLGDHGVATLIHYPIPPHLQPAYADLGYKKGAFPIAENLAATSLSLPLWPGMEKRDVDYVVELLLNFKA